MAFVVKGRVSHRDLDEPELRAALQRHLSGLVVASPAYVVNMSDCKVRLFPEVNSVLDFTVTHSKPRMSTVAAITALLRVTDTLTQALVNALSKRFRRAEVKWCTLEDAGSASLLRRSEPNALRTRAAKVSYIISIVLLVVAGIVSYYQSQHLANADVIAGVISVAIGIGLPAILVPLPFLFEYFKTRNASCWDLAIVGGGVS